MIAVISDIHGCYFTLQELVQKVRDKYPRINIFSVGDLVDRGNFSFEVIEFIKSENIAFTPGNHDYMFCYFMRQYEGRMAKAWLQNGSEKTIASYKQHDNYLSDHIELILNTPLFIDNEDCFISHAGISVYYEHAIQYYFNNDIAAFERILRDDVENTESILWTRGKLLNIGRLQVVGHTRRQEVEYNSECNILYIDTSVYMMNKLSAAIIDNNNIVDILSVNTHPEDLI